MFKTKDFQPQSMAGLLNAQVHLDITGSPISSPKVVPFCIPACTQMDILCYGFHQVSRTGGTGVAAQLTTDDSLISTTGQTVLDDGSSDLSFTGTGDGEMFKVFEEPIRLDYQDLQQLGNYADWSYQYCQIARVNLIFSGSVTAWDGEVWLWFRPFNKYDLYGKP